MNEIDSKLEKSSEIATNDKLENWTNDDNLDFYGKISADTFQNRAIKEGLESCYDLKAVENYIEKATSILEVGGGYGRAINYLLKRGFNGKIATIERSKQFCELLQKRFGNRLEIFELDLKHGTISDKFDIILWLWSGISDFSKSEQPSVVAKLASYLTPTGVFIIDTFPHTLKPPKAIAYKPQSYIIQEDYQKVYGYVPSSAEIENYSKLAGLFKIKHQEYETPVGRKSFLHILSK